MGEVGELRPWAISGTYLESCNCEAICPCRTIGGRGGGRSSFGVCLGALSWRITDGRAGELALSGVSVVLVGRYDDDEPGSPWDFYLYVDDRANGRQRDALERIFLGHAGGTPLKQFPWAFKASRPLGVRAARIEIEHAPGRGWFRVGSKVTVRIRGPIADQETVTCVIPGHHQAGREVYAETLAVDDPPLGFELTDSCGYESQFAYSSEDHT